MVDAAPEPQTPLSVPPTVPEPANPPTVVATGLGAIDQPSPAESPEVVSWTASEFIAHDKSSSWYGGVGLAAAALAGVVYLITRDFISVAVVFFGALMFVVYGSRKPRQVEYQVDPSGITVGGKHFGYDDFRTFSVVSEGAFSSIVFMPLKRFALPLSIYYAPEDEDRIASILVDRLPFEQKGLDIVERLMRQIRF